MRAGVFLVKINIYEDIHICISVPLKQIVYVKPVTKIRY